MVVVEEVEVVVVVVDEVVVEVVLVVKVVDVVLYIILSIQWNKIILSTTESMCFL